MTTARIPEWNALGVPPPPIDSLDGEQEALALLGACRASGGKS